MNYYPLIIFISLGLGACAEAGFTTDAGTYKKDVSSDITKTNDMPDKDLNPTKDMGHDSTLSKDLTEDLIEEDLTDVDMGSPKQNCEHTTEHGIYGHLACSNSYQCCDGRWTKLTTQNCGECKCVEGTGKIGCGATHISHLGITYMGSEIPRVGLKNPTGGVGTEKFGEVVKVDGKEWVRGKLSHFGGPSDTGVGPNETGAISGEKLRDLNKPENPTKEQIEANPASYYYLAMRWNYSPGNKAFWKTARIILRNPDNGKSVILRPVDWGPHIRTGRIVDISPQAVKDLGSSTDKKIDIAFAPKNAPLGPIH